MLRPESVIGVSALNRLVRDMLERQLPLAWVRGEISNFTAAASGHWYFSLKDATAQVRCAMFRNRSRLLDWQPANGMLVEVRALVTLYEARGEFQLNVETLRRAGAGALYEALERLKRKLEAEGLFDAARKRAMPRFPRTIGVVSSPAAAALRDVLTVLRRRMPALRVIVYPTPVQGAGAAQRIAEAISTASARAECDLLIVCRGGGSIEDLWAFNEEPVARAIHACRIPVISGVGHETDFTIADFVADLRAPTPSAAAEAASPDRMELMRHLRMLVARARRGLARTLQDRAQQVDYLARRLIDPRERLRIRAQHLTQLGRLLSGAWAQRLGGARAVLDRLARRLVLARPDAAVAAAAVQRAGLRLEAAASARFELARARLAHAQARLEALNPHAVLARGYALAVRADGQIARDSAELAVGERLLVTLARGRVVTDVVETQPGDDP